MIDTGSIFSADGQKELNLLQEQDPPHTSPSAFPYDFLKKYYFSKGIEWLKPGVKTSMYVVRKFTTPVLH